MMNIRRKQKADEGNSSSADRCNRRCCNPLLKRGAVMIFAVAAAATPAEVSARNRGGPWRPWSSWWSRRWTSRGGEFFVTLLPNHVYYLSCHQLICFTFLFHLKDAHSDHDHDNDHQDKVSGYADDHSGHHSDQHDEVSSLYSTSILLFTLSTKTSSYIDLTCSNTL